MGVTRSANSIRKRLELFEIYGFLEKSWFLWLKIFKVLEVDRFLVTICEDTFWMEDKKYGRKSKHRI